MGTRIAYRKTALWCLLAAVGLVVLVELFGAFTRANLTFFVIAALLLAALGTLIASFVVKDD